MSRTHQVALLIETSRQYGRDLIDGIAAFGRKANWSIHLRPRGLNEPPPDWLKTWQGDGILARIGDRAMLQAVQAMACPAVDLSGLLPKTGLPFVGVDNVTTGTMSTDYFLSRGFRHLAFYALQSGRDPNMDRRCASFQAAAKKQRVDCYVLEAETADDRRSWSAQRTRLKQWLKSLPQPIGLMASHDELALRVLDACTELHWRIPDQIAVLGADNDITLCRLSHPPLSSMDVNARTIGHEAAALLDRAMRSGKPLSDDPLFIQPAGIVTRISTDWVAIEDPDIAAALRLVREHTGTGLRVDDLVEKTALSRSTFERRFKTLTGKTPKAFLLSDQIDRARRLLVETDLGLETIAQRSGFGRAKDLCATFRRMLNTTPGHFRQHNF